MDALETYLMEEHPIDQRDIAEVERLLPLVVDAFARTFNPSTGWPYEIRKGPSVTQDRGKVSQSTTAMILGALLHLGGYSKSSQHRQAGDASRAKEFPLDLADETRVQLCQIIKEASALLLMGVLGYKPQAAAGETHSSNHSEPSTKSTTFGKNDVFTLAWLSELCQADWSSDADAKGGWQTVSDWIFEKARSKLTKSKQFTEPAELLRPESSPRRSITIPLPHAFPALRLVQAIRTIKGNEYSALAEYYEYFERALHEQLSFSSIPDSRFDPAEGQVLSLL